MKKNSFKELENKIMTEIKSGRVKLRSKYLFLAEKLGLNSALILSIILAILLFSLSLFYIRATDNLYYLSFGKYGIWAFLESFPYMLVIAFIAFIILAGFLISKTNWSYKKPFGYLALSLTLIVLIFGSMIAYTNVTRHLERQAFNNSFPGVLVKPLINSCMEAHNNGIAGEIYKKNSGYLIVKTPRGLEKIDCIKIDCNHGFEISQFIVAVGERTNHGFMLKKIKIADQENFPPVIRRGIEREFCPHDCHANISNYNSCSEDCLMHKVFPKECLQNCME